MNDSFISKHDKQALLALINEAKADNIKSLVTDMQMDMRLKFDAKHDDFQTFDGMCAFMNLWVAERIAELKAQQEKPNDQL